MNEKIDQLSKKYSFNLPDSETFKMPSAKSFIASVHSSFNRSKELDKTIKVLEKELEEAKSLKEQIEIIQIKKYISMKELQIYIGKSRAWINNQILTADFPSGSKKSGKEHLFLRSAVDKWIDQTY